jgi:anti-sigma B factor antagonist
MTGPVILRGRSADNVDVPEMQTGELVLEVERLGGAVIALTARGELDITTAPALREQLALVVEAKPESLVLDLTDVSFMDSVALAAVVQASREMGDPSRLLIVVGSDSYARLVLDATGLSKCLNVVTARDESTRGAD